MILFFSHLKSKLAVLQCDAASQNVALTFVKTSLTKTKYILNFKSKRTIAEKTPHVNTGIIQVIWSHPPKLQKRVLKKKNSGVALAPCLGQWQRREGRRPPPEVETAGRAARRGLHSPGQGGVAEGSGSLTSHPAPQGSKQAPREIWVSKFYPQQRGKLSSGKAY